MICILCGEPVLDKEADALYFDNKVHLDCIRDIMCPHEELERT